MAKPKGGLGRGLNALFDDSPRPATASEENIEKEQVVTEKPTPVESTPSPQSVKSERTSIPQDIYISDDAVETAKVVEREARKPVSPTKTPTKRTSAEQRKSTASLMEERQKAQQNASLEASSEQEEVKKPVVPAPKQDETGMVGEVPLAKVKPNPDQPRTNFKPEEIEELANSIKREGLLQPILVRKVGQEYQIIAGERRWQACRSLNMETIPVRFWLADNDKALELALVENIQRSDLNPIEEAYGYKRLMERRGMTQSEVAQTVSKGRSTIANALRLLDLPEEAQQLLFEDKISAGHARAILSIPTPEGRKTLTNKLMEEKLSVRETEAIARLLSGREKSKEEGTKRIPAPASFKKAARGLSRFLSVPVRVKTVQGKNKIEIHFKDEEELERICAAIAKED